MNVPSMYPIELRRSIGTLALALYGIGVTVGAGIYVLVGEVARVADRSAPLSFVLAALVIAPTAASFAELASRYPRSAGEALYVKMAFGSTGLARLIGLMVASAGIISAAAVAIGAAGYLREFVDIPKPAIASAIILALGAIAAWGVVQSVVFAVIISIFEVGALIVIVALAAPTMPDPLGDLAQVWPHAGGGSWSGIAAGLLLAFFAFVGFEDMVNMAEEVKRPQRAIPIAIALTLVATGLLYLVVVFVATSAMPAQELANSDAPLAGLYARVTGGNPAVITSIAIGSTVNTVLIQMVMAARVFYGLANEGALPRLLGRVSASTQTPLIATGVSVILVLVLVLFFPIDMLARATSAIILAIFIAVNLSLLALKRRGDEAPAFGVPLIVPAVGIVLSAAVFLLELWRLMQG